MTCRAKHVKYEPTDEEWRCPKCGAGAGDFYCDTWEEGADEYCELLHESADVRCIMCDYKTTGKAFSALIVKKGNLVKCPCCKGKGFVKASNEDRGAVSGKDAQPGPRSGGVRGKNNPR